jgi:hypothetical protein
MLRERHPERSLYNRLCASEWDSHPLGETKSCGGNAMMRIAAVDQAGGFRSDLVAGEEPELCNRMRAAGWRVWHVRDPMALHDAAMLHFSQWWRRGIRSGYGTLQVAMMCGGPPAFHGIRPVLSTWLWAAGVPLCALALVPLLGAWGMLVLLLYPLQVARLALHNRRRGDGAWQALFDVLVKFPNMVGQLQCLAHRRKARLIEYKAGPGSRDLARPAGIHLVAGNGGDGPEARQVLVGVLLDGRRQEQWVVEALRQALAVQGTKLGAVAIADARPRPSMAMQLHRVVDLVDRMMRCWNEPLFRRVDLLPELGSVTPLQLPPLHQRDCWRADGAAAEILAGAGVDVWLCFTALPPCLPFPKVARCGVWGLEIGLRMSATHPWAAASEICAGSPVTLAQLVDYSRPGFNAIYRACGATITNSARRNRLVTLRKAMSFYRRKLAALVHDGGDATGHRGAWAPVPAQYPECTAPTVQGAWTLLWRLLARVAANRWNAMGFRNQWRIGYYFAEETAEAAHQPERLHCLVPPRDRDWADPFVLEHEGRRFIFFEELPYSAGKGHISAIEIGADGKADVVRRVLERPYHLSYPFMFNWEGELYMLPETEQNSTVEVYRCVEFPHRWTLHKVMLEGIRAFDATLLQQGERWWLFVNVAESGADPSEELHLYHGPSPLGPWTPHVANPVVSDVRRARGAGPLFRRNGALYRPSQDCSHRYGYAVTINRVDVLDESRYEETPVDRINPAWRDDMKCLHTMGAAGTLRVVDFQVRRPKWSRA